MKNINSFFNSMMDDVARMNICKIAKVVKFYPETNKADVVILPSKDNPMILNVPVAHVRSQGFFIYTPLKTDDKVVLLFADYDTDSILFDVDDLATERAHDVSDCVCIGGLTLFNEQLKIKDAESLCVQSIDGKSSVVVKDSGVEINAKDIKIKGSNIAIEGNISLNTYATYKGSEIAVKGDNTSDGAVIK
jgi:hypothetical protein